jgi:hypothetical protein
MGVSSCPGRFIRKFSVLHSSLCRSLLLLRLYRFAALLYTPEGKVVIERVWEETLAELEFAGVRPILESMRA